MPTERDVILAKRQGWVAAKRDNYSNLAPNLVEEFERRAAVVYPLPTITRPRVFDDPDAAFGQVWRCCDGIIQWAPHARAGAHQWRNLLAEPLRQGTITEVTTDRILLWADLLANPTEEVPDDGTEPAA